MTDKQHDTRQDTQKTAGELQGRARRGQRGREGHGRNKPRGRGDTDDSSREQREQKKEYVIFKGEKREKRP